MEDLIRRLFAASQAFATGKVERLSYEDEGVLVHVTLATGEDVDCRRMLGYGGAGFGDFWELDRGQEVLVLLVGGDPNEAILIGPLQTLQTPTPGGLGPGKRVIVVRDGDSVEVRATGDISVQTTGTARVDAPLVELGGAGLAPTTGLVQGEGVDPFTGATYSALGNASARVRAQK